MTNLCPALLVFTDLDGTLLDHHSYDWRPARPALEALTRHGMGLVLASSKTAAEIAPLRAEIGFGDWPAIVENGAGVLPPGTAHVSSQACYDRLRDVLNALPAVLRAPFCGFGDMSLGALSQHTGLGRDQARAAKARDFSEPGLWSGDDAGLAAFLDALSQAGVTGRRGGRFLTLSFGATKADRMAEIIARYRPGRTLALGDAPNDIEMLETADRGVIIANPDATPLPPLTREAMGQIRRSTAPGPIGWNDAVLAELSIERT